MKCQSQISEYCEKDIPKEKIKYINKMRVCGNCLWKIKQIKKKEKENERKN